LAGYPVGLAEKSTRYSSLIIYLRMRAIRGDFRQNNDSRVMTTEVSADRPFASWTDQLIRQTESIQIASLRNPYRAELCNWVIPQMVTTRRLGSSSQCLYTTLSHVDTRPQTFGQHSVTADDFSHQANYHH